MSIGGPFDALPPEALAGAQAGGPVVDFSYERDKREEDNALVDPINVLRMAIEKFEAAGVKPTKIVVIAHVPVGDDGRFTGDSFRAGVSRYEEIAMLELHKDYLLRDWTGRE